MNPHTAFVFMNLYKYTMGLPRLREEDWKTEVYNKLNVIIIWVSNFRELEIVLINSWDDFDINVFNV
jgi:hypothetical protein